VKLQVFDQPLSLMEKTILMAKEKDPAKLSSETGISFYWLKKFTSGKFRNPSVNRVQFLYEHLNNSSLL